MVMRVYGWRQSSPRYALRISACLITARERPVLQLIAEGKIGRQTASLLGISIKTAASTSPHNEEIRRAQHGRPCTLRYLDGRSSRSKHDFHRDVVSIPYVR